MGAETRVKKAVYFDLYGTLINIRTDENDPWVYETLSRYLAYHSVNISPEELKKTYQESIQQCLSHSKEEYPEVDVYDIFFGIINKYGKRKYSKGTVIDTIMLFRSLTIRTFCVFDCVYDVLVSLGRRYKLAIISDAQWIFAEPEMAMLGLDQFIKHRILSSRTGYKKPDIRLFQQAMNDSGVHAADSVYIGDNPYKDLVGAKKAGMKCILYRSPCSDYNGAHPDGCFYEYPELENIIREIL